MGLDGRTPAEAAGIKIVGRDKWMTIIGNAGMYRLGRGAAHSGCAGNLTSRSELLQAP